MTPHPVARRGALLALAALLVGGCIYYPAISDVGGRLLKPENGRLVREGDGAKVYFDLKSTGKFGDTLRAVVTPVAKSGHIVLPNGVRVGQLEIPGQAVVQFGPGAQHLELTELTRALTPGEVVIVTLVFQHFGNLGVITVVE